METIHGNTYFNRLSFLKLKQIAARQSVVGNFTPKSIESTWLRNICFDEYNINATVAEEVPDDANEWTNFRRFLLKISQPCSKMLYDTMTHATISINPPILFWKYFVKLYNYVLNYYFLSIGWCVATLWTHSDAWKYLTLYCLTKVQTYVQDFFSLHFYKFNNPFWLVEFNTYISGLCCIFNPVDSKFLYRNPLKWVFIRKTLGTFFFIYYFAKNHYSIQSNTTSFEDDENQEDVIPIDWTPERGYADLSMKKISSPRPASGWDRSLNWILQCIQIWTILRNSFAKNGI